MSTSVEGHIELPPLVSSWIDPCSSWLGCWCHLHHQMMQQCDQVLPEIFKYINY